MRSAHLRVGHSSKLSDLAVQVTLVKVSNSKGKSAECAIRNSSFEHHAKRLHLNQTESRKTWKMSRLS